MTYRAVIRFRRRANAAACLLISLVAFCSLPAGAQGNPNAKTREMVRAIHREKAARTPAERKIDPHLLYAARRARGQQVAPGIDDIPGMTRTVKSDGAGRLEVDLRGAITDALLQHIRTLGGHVVNAHPQYNAARIRIRLEHLEDLAALPEVKSLMRAEQPFTDSVKVPSPGSATTDAGSANPRRGLSQRLARVQRFLPEQVRRAASGGLLASLVPAAGLAAFFPSSTVTTEGDVAHEADQLRAAGIDGTGINIGVLSDGVDSLNDLIAAGELPSVTVIPGQAGSGTEGTAMLEIIHDMAPGANLFFATAGGGQEQMMLNIMMLQAAGCNIIVDDIGYPTEAAFQDGTVSFAVNYVTAQGVLYFSSAGNAGNFNDGTSGVWEGNFNGAGEYDGMPAHVFSGGDIGNTLVAASSNGMPVSLQWADPYYAAENDYDLYVVDGGGNVICASTYGQGNGDSDHPTEWCDAPPAGSRIIVVLYDGDPARALHVNSNRGLLQYNTPGQTFGHHAAYNSITVAAVPVSTAAGGVFPGGPTTQVETFSSDGPRRLFYEPDDTPITDGIYIFGGGRELLKVNIAAADCVTTASPGFLPFCGTSAAAPHAAAIGALLWSAKPSATLDELRQAMFYRALDIEEDGWDRDSGYGIVMAKSALSLLVTFDLAIEKTHAGSFYQGQNGAVYSILVRNLGPSPSVGPVTVAEGLPAGLTLSNLQGSGWSCDALSATCTRSDALASGASYPPITVTVNVSLAAPSSVTNTATLQSTLDKGTGNNTAADATVVRQGTTTTANAASSQYSDAATLTATVTPAVAGTMEFRVDGILAGTAPVTAGTASFSYVIPFPAGPHAITANFISGDPLYLNSSGAASLSVSKENAVITALLSNPAAVQVNTSGGTAGPIILQADIVEEADGSLGDITKAVPVSLSLAPQLGGATIPCTATTALAGTGRLRATCVFPSVAVNLYLVTITVGGNYYTGSGTALLTVYDPSLGFVTGGGYVLRAGYAASFGFNVKFVKNGNAKGSLLYIEQQAGGDVVLKSNALGPLVIVGNSAAMQGKGTLNGVGNYSFVATVRDNGEPGVADQFGIQVMNPANQLLPGLSYPPGTIAGGNIQVPQPSGK